MRLVYNSRAAGTLERVENRWLRSKSEPYSAPQGFWQTAFNLLLILLIGCTLAGCEGRNPAQISALRQGEEPAVQKAAPAPSAENRAAKPPLTIPPPGTTDRTTPSMEGLKRLDLAEAQRSGALSIAVNDPVFPPRLPRIFDGNTETLSRTEDVNPLILTFTFKEEILLKAVRLYPSYSSYDWILRAHPQAESLIVRSAVAKEWSGIDLPTAVKTLSVRIELKRLLRDNFVHLNEIEFYSE